MRAGATSLTKLLVMPSCGGIVFFGRPTSLFRCCQAGVPSSEGVYGSGYFVEDATALFQESVLGMPRFAGDSILSILLNLGLHWGAEVRLAFLASVLSFKPAERGWPQSLIYRAILFHLSTLVKLLS